MGIEAQARSYHGQHNHIGCNWIAPFFFLLLESSRDFSAICFYNAKSYSYLAQDLDQVARHAHRSDISTSTCALNNQRIAAVSLGVEADDVV